MSVRFITHHLFAIAAMVCAGVPSNAQTVLSGVISANTTLTLADSPYLVTGNLLVSPNVQLSIEPGVVVRFNPVQLLVQGTLIAHGTTQDSIRFEGIVQTTTGWDGLRIGNSPGAKIDLLYFRGRFATVLFDHEHTTGTDTIIKAVHSLFDNNQTVMDIASASSSSTNQYFDHCVFVNNSNVTVHGCNTTFKNSTLTNGSTGIRNVEVSSMFTRIDSCTFSYLNYVAAGDRINVTNSVFHHNEMAISWWFGTQVHGCTIIDNEVGVDVFSASQNSPNTVTQNTICNNTHNVELEYSSDFLAPYNCWCLHDSSDIRQTIEDFFSTSGLGIVYFMPFDTGCAITADVNEPPMPPLEIRAFPNPATDRITVSLPKFTQNAVLRLIDLTGCIILISTQAHGDAQIDVSGMRAGIYLLEIETDTTISRRRHLIQ